MPLYLLLFSHEMIAPTTWGARGAPQTLAASAAHEGLLKHMLWDPTLRVSDSLGLTWDVLICIPSKLPSHAVVAG